MDLIADIPQHYLAEAHAAWRVLGAPPVCSPATLSYTRSSVSVDGVSVQYALDSHGMRHVLVPLPSGAAKRDRTCSGIWIDTVNLDDVAGVVRWIDISHQARANPELFELFTASVIWELARSSSSASGAVVVEAFTRWRNLFGRQNAGELDREAALGLFGELWFLEALTAIRSDAVDYWTGPEAQAQDFQFRRGVLEVKTVTSRSSRQIHISSLEQLLSDRPIAIGVLAVDAGTGERTHIADLIEAVFETTSNPARFTRLLALYGISRASARESTSLRFSLRNVALYRVADGFPRLTEGSFVGGEVPHGVDAVSYQVDLNAVAGECALKIDWLRDVLCE